VVEEVAVVVAPVVEEVAVVATPVVDATVPVVAPIIGAVAPVVQAVAPHAPADISPVVGLAQSQVIVQDVSGSMVFVTAGSVDIGVGSLTASSVRAGNVLLPNVFTPTTSPQTESDSGQAAAVGQDSLLTTGAPVGSTPEPLAPSLPNVPGPTGVPGCPGHSGSGPAGSGSLHVAAATPFGQHLVLARAQRADGDRAAALLTRCDEPGSSPD